MGKMSSKKPAPASPDEFIAGAEKGLSPSEERKPRSPKVGYPWEAPSVRMDVQKVKTIRIAEPYLLKLNYIAKNSPKSAERFIRDILEPAIDKEIAKLTEK